MRYEKPVVMDLSAGARAAGHGPLACVPGASAVEGVESCAPGNGAGWSCSGGPFGGNEAVCASGGDPGFGNDCLNGTTVTGYCMGGSLGGHDPSGCRAGPFPL